MRKDASGNTALIHTAKENKIDCMNILLERGSKPERKNEEGDTALVVAVTEGHIECVRALLLYGADASVANANGVTLGHNSDWKWFHGNCCVAAADAKN